MNYSVLMKKRMNALFCRKADERVHPISIAAHMFGWRVLEDALRCLVKAMM